MFTTVGQHCCLVPVRLAAFSQSFGLFDHAPQQEERTLLDSQAKKTFFLPQETVTVCRVVPVVATFYSSKHNNAETVSFFLERERRKPVGSDGDSLKSAVCIHTCKAGGSCLLEENAGKRWPNQVLSPRADTLFYTEVFATRRRSGNGVYLTPTLVWTR